MDYATLAEFLGALAYPVRLQLLDALRFPRTLGEIRVAPHRALAGANPDRSLARPTVLGHLEKLVEKELVRVDHVEQGGKAVARYVVNPARLYALMEELRRLSVRHAGRGVAEDATGTVEPFVDVPPPEGPRLMLVHGVYEGKAFPLDASSAANDEWAIGRDRGLPVSLDYDPYVSATNAVVRRHGEGYAVADLGSKNGTSVNWVPLPPHGARLLRAGDVIGVGRSRLSFIPE